MRRGRARRSLHVTIALSTWLLLLFRIYWRAKMKHPRARGQSLFIHRVARTTHYTMLVCVGLMMVSGPVMVFVENPMLTEVAFTIHAASGTALLALVLVHIGGTLKHIIFHEDDTIVRMLWPPPWFVTHRNLKDLGQRMTDFEYAPSLTKIPGIFLALLKG